MASRNTERDGDRVDVERSLSDTQTIIDDVVLKQFGPSEKPIAQVLGVKGSCVFVRTHRKCVPPFRILQVCPMKQLHHLQFTTISGTSSRKLRMV